MHNKPIFILLVFFYTFCISAMEQSEQSLAHRLNSLRFLIDSTPLDLNNENNFVNLITQRYSYQPILDASAEEAIREYDEELDELERAQQEEEQRKLKLKQQKEKRKSIIEQWQEIEIQVRRRLKAKNKRKKRRKRKKKKGSRRRHSR